MTRRRREGAGTASALAAFLVTGALLTTGAGCQGPPPARLPEALPQVETRYDQAVLTSLSRVPGGRLLSVRVTGTSGPDPVWVTRVADDKGTVRAVRVDAADGRFLDTSVPAPQPSASEQHTAALLASATVSPEEAVDKVKKPEFGKVTAVSLEKGDRGRTVWAVTVATVRSGQTHNYQIDAATSEVVRSSPTPGNSALPSEPAGPTASPSRSPG